MEYKLGDTVQLKNTKRKDVIMGVTDYSGLSTSTMYFSPVWAHTNISRFMLTSCRIVLVEKEDKRFELYEYHNRRN